MSSSFGTLFRATTFGESHGGAVGAVIDGCPAGLPLAETDIQPQLDRRRPGQSDLATPRRETDSVRIVAGVADGHTLGTPLALIVANQDARPQDYAHLADVPRPSHADFTYRAKYGATAPSGGGRASARETVARVAAGGVADRLLAERFGVEIVAWVQAIGGVALADDAIAVEALTRTAVDREPIRCPAAGTVALMTAAVRAARDEGDSLGGVVAGVVRGAPAGWGEPVFDKVEALLAQAMLSIPAVKGFAIGSGFAGARMRGSEHNDPFVQKGDRLGTATNHSGGVQGGITNGEPILFRVAFKPPASVARTQRTADYTGREMSLEVGGRHDPCVVPRAVPVVEAMAALVLADLALRQESRAR